MKTTAVVLFLLLAFVAMLGLRDFREHRRLVEKEHRLESQAISLGLTISGTIDPAENGRMGSPARAGKEHRRNLSQAEIVSLAQGIFSSRWGVDDQGDGGTKAERVEFLERIGAMSANQIEELIRQVRSTPDINDAGRMRMIAIILSSSSRAYPEMALRLLLQQPDVLRDKLASQVSYSAIGALASRNLPAALDWVRENRLAHPQLIQGDLLKSLVVAAAAQQGPDSAFGLARELDPGMEKHVALEIAAVAKTREQRDAVLAALRKHAAMMPEGLPRTRLMNSVSIKLATGALDEEFESGSAWLKSSGMPVETLEVVFDLQTAKITSGVGRWAEWIGREIPTTKGRQAVSSLVGRWVNTDRGAAVEWLNQAPRGDVRDAALLGFTAAVSKVDPLSAAEWAATISTGESRRRAMETIHRNWPREREADVAAAAEFAREHGL